MKSPVLKKTYGPCVQKLDETLCQLHVQRQAYHGKSFVGNHVHKMLKVKINFIAFSKSSKLKYCSFCFQVSPAEIMIC